MSHRFFSQRTYAAPFGRYEAGNEAESPADEVLVGREGQRAYFIDQLLRRGKRGAYLVTGHRGVGKSNFVRYCLNEYQKEVFERSLRSNVGRATFWDRLALLSLVALAVLLMLMISELAEFVGLAISESGEGPRNLLLWFVLAPLGLLCLYPVLSAREILELVSRAIASLPRRKPPQPASAADGAAAKRFARILKRGAGRAGAVVTSLVMILLSAILWFWGPFGAPAVSMSRMLCALAAVYLWVQATSFRASGEKGLLRWGTWNWLTCLFLILVASYVFLLPLEILDYPFLPVKEIFGNWGLTFMFAGMGCFLRGQSSYRLRRETNFDQIRRDVAWAFLWAGGLLAVSGLLFLIYWGITWGVLVGLVVLLGAELSFLSRTRRRRMRRQRLEFAPQPLLVLSVKAVLAVTISLQLVHPVIAKTEVDKVVTLLRDAETVERRLDATRSRLEDQEERRRPGFSLVQLEKRRWFRLAVPLWRIPGIKAKSSTELTGWGIFQGPREEMTWLLCVFLSLLLLYHIEYEWIVRPFWRQRGDGAIDPNQLAPTATSAHNRRILRELAEATFPWLLYRAWLPVLSGSVNLGFERLDHRRVVHAMLASLRATYFRKFLAWNSSIANLGRLLGLLVLLLLMAIVGERWFSMPKVGMLDDNTLHEVVTKDYQDICRLFEGRQHGPGAVNVICKLPWGDRIFHALTYNLATAGISSRYRLQSNHVLFYLVPYLEEDWPPREEMERIRKEMEREPARPRLGRGSPAAAALATPKAYPPLFEGGLHIRVYHLLLLILLYLAGKFLLRRLHILPYRETLKKIDNVTDQLSSTTSVTSTTALPQPSNWLRGFLVDERVRQVQQDPVDPRTVEFLFLHILDEIQGSVALPGGKNQLLSLPTPEITFVFDELDKVGSRIDPGAEGPASGSGHQREPLHADRRRSAELHKLLADMKNLLSSAPARFIFVGGRNLHDEWLADQTARQPLLTTIFDAEVYLPSLLTDYSQREEETLHERISEYIRTQAKRAKSLQAASLRRENLPFFSLAVDAYSEESFVPPEEKAELVLLSRSTAAVMSSISMLANVIDDKAMSGALEELEKAISVTETKEIWEILGRRSIFREWAESKMSEASSFLWQQIEEKSTVGVQKGLERARAAGREIREEVRNLRVKNARGAKSLARMIRSLAMTAAERSPSLEQRDNLLREIDSLMTASKGEERQARLAIQEVDEACARFSACLVEIENRVAARAEDEAPYGLKIFDAKNGERNEAQEIALNRDFAQFLAYRSKGNPKRLKELLASFVRPVGRVVEGAEVRERFDCEHVLMFDKVAQFRIQLLSRVYSHLMGIFEPHIVQNDDKLALSVLYLADFLFKFHRRAFSWSNLERVDELVHIHRAPDLRDNLERLVRHWTVQTLHPIRNGMYDFRFLGEVAREIEFISRESQEEMAAFNFTLDESLTLKSVYETTIQQLSEGRGKELQDLVAGLGELYEFDQEYETARLYYRRANSLLDQDLREITGGSDFLEIDSPALKILGAMPEGQRNARLYMTWGIRRLRLMMQIGMTFELARNYEQAQVEYRNAYTLARSLLLAMLDEAGRRRAVAKGIVRHLPPPSEERVQELKHLTLLFQPAFAQAWLGEKLVGAVDTSAALVERELWELRQVLPFVRERTRKASESPIDVTHSNFGLIMSDLHNKAGDLYFMKGRQLIGLPEVQAAVQAQESGKQRTGQEGYLLQAHYHYCTALHFLRIFISERRESSRHWLNIWTASDERWPTLSEKSWPAFVYSAAGEAFSDLGDGMVARVSYSGLLHRLKWLPEFDGGKEGASAEGAAKELIKICTDWLEGVKPTAGEFGPVQTPEKVLFNLPVRGHRIPAGTMSGWLGIWRTEESAPRGLPDERLLNFDEWIEHDDETRLAMAINFMLTGAKYLERGGYLEDAAREYLKACEAVSYYLWWGLAAVRLYEWVMVPEESDEQLIGFRNIFENNLRLKEKGELPCQAFWTYLTELGIYALVNADRLFGRSRETEISGEPKDLIGSAIPPFSLTLACSLGMVANHFGGIADAKKLMALLRRWLGPNFTAVSSVSLREALCSSLIHHSYPTVNRLHGLMVLIQDSALEAGALGEAERSERIMGYALELKELNSRFDAPMYFTPFSSGVAYGLAYIYCSKVPSSKGLEEIRRAAQKDLAASEEMITLRGTYYENISRLHYLYDDFNDRQLHFNHAIQMAGSELALLLKYIVNLQDRRGRSQKIPARPATRPLTPPRTPEPPGTTSPAGPPARAASPSSSRGAP